MRPIEFLLDVWDHTCKDGDFVFLSTKSKRKRWKDYSFEYRRGIKNELKDWFADHSVDDYDIYFCPLPFVGRRRLKNLVSRVNCLWSDIDEGKAKIKPTLLWESSPGRLQALWYLRGSMSNAEGEELNKNLTYYMDADKGGWDLSQVLRVPGTKNHKYKTHPRVRILEENYGLKYSKARLEKRIGTVEKKKEEPLIKGNKTFEQIFSKYRREIPARVKRLLTAKHVTEGKRSDILWYMENKLSEAGLGPDEILTLIKNSAWNKYRGRSDEDKRLVSEMSKIIETKTDAPDEEEIEEEVEEEDALEMEVEHYDDVMSSFERPPGWLVRGFWMNNSHGIVAGEPKTFKSTIALDLAVSVASGKDFMGKYPVENTGPVLYIQNENAKWIMKDRLEKIAHSRDALGKIRKKGKNKFKIYWPDSMPIHFINQQSFLLTDPLHQKVMEEALKQIRPTLVILDPLYLMFDGDINSAKDLTYVLSWLLEMRFKYNCGMMVIHHYNKGQAGHAVRGGQRMLGSTTLHGWIESAWYMSSKESTITMEKEFRGAAMYPRQDFKIEMEDPGKLGYNIEEVEQAEDQLDVVLNYVKLFKSGVDKGTMAKELQMKRSQLLKMIDELIKEGSVEMKGRKVVPV